MLLMYAEPAQTQVMSAADRGAIGRKHAALRAEFSILDSHVTAIEIRPVHDSVELDARGLCL